MHNHTASLWVLLSLVRSSIRLPFWSVYIFCKLSMSLQIIQSFNLYIPSLAMSAACRGKQTQCRLPTKRSFVSSPLSHEKRQPFRIVFFLAENYKRSQKCLFSKGVTIKSLTFRSYFQFATLYFLSFQIFQSRWIIFKNRPDRLAGF